jgi:hypothetical protein
MTIKNFFLIGIKWVGNCVRSLKHSIIGKKMVKKAKAKKAKVSKVMHEFKEGALKSGSKKGPKVKSRKQAIAIALAESRKVGTKKKK